jgi:tetratricopeptide (TPR) repeat protein
MRHLTLTLLVLAALTSTVVGDDMHVRSELGSVVEYRGGTVVSVDDCAIVFRQPSGNETTTPLANVAYLVITGEAEFNAAEDALQEGDVDEAMRMYRQAQNISTNEWMIELGEIRRIQATAMSDDIDQAVDDWIELLVDQDFSENSRLLLPQNVSTDDEANRAALELLTELRQREGIAKADDISPNAPEAALWLSITEQMATLAEALGDTELVVQLASEMIGSGGPGDGDDGTGPDDTRLSSEAVDRTLDATELLLAYPERQDEVVETVTGLLNSCGRAQLVRAFVMRGEAFYNLAKAALAEDDDAQYQAMLKEAGLDYMYVVVFFKNYPEASDALLQAAIINEELGNLVAARGAYERIVAEYKTSDAAADAKEAIDRLVNADSE